MKHTHTAVPVEVPDGPDRDTWLIAAPDGIESYPKREPYLPHDANSRAGMIGHAGFGANKQQFTDCLQNWLDGGWPQRQVCANTCIVCCLGINLFACFIMHPLLSTIP